MTKNIAKYILRKEWLFYFVSIVISAITFFFWCCIFFDEQAVYADYGGKAQMDLHDESMMHQLGLSGITRQSYIIPMFFFLIILLFFYVLWAYVSYKDYGKSIVLMRVRGMNKWQSQYRFLFIRLLYFVIASMISLSLCFLGLWIMFLLMQTKHMIVRFSPYLFSVIASYLVVYLVINLPFYSFPYKREKLIHFLRENY
ncbi:MAG: hypothetical protein K5762_05675 [Bacilli bacterium]|nr:hypothetical protein [Bacilli bacterium]